MLANLDATARPDLHLGGAARAGRRRDVPRGRLRAGPGRGDGHLADRDAVPRDAPQARGRGAASRWTRPGSTRPAGPERYVERLGPCSSGWSGWHERSRCARSTRARCARSTRPTTACCCWWPRTGSPPSTTCWRPPIPDKGKILTQLSLWWFEQLADIVPNHLVDAAIPAEFAGPGDGLPAAEHDPGGVRGPRLPGRLGPRASTGASGAVCGVPLPAGLAEGSRLPEPIFTPATKAPRGEHDENIPASAVAGMVGADVAAELERITLAVYRRGADLAARRGIIVADTKIELGFDADGTLLLADEVLTPDSSRFWPAEPVAARAEPAVARQAVRPGLARPRRSPAGIARHRAAAAAARTGRRAHPCQVRRGIREHHRTAVAVGLARRAMLADAAPGLRPSERPRSPAGTPRL